MWNSRLPSSVLGLDLGERDVYCVCMIRGQGNGCSPRRNGQRTPNNGHKRRVRAQNAEHRAQQEADARQNAEAELAKL